MLPEAGADGTLNNSFLDSIPTLDRFRTTLQRHNHNLFSSEAFERRRVAEPFHFLTKIEDVYRPPVTVVPPFTVHFCCASMGCFHCPRSIAVGDIDGDGFSDAVAAGWYGITWYQNVAGTATGIASDETQWVGLADIDGDGDLDVVACNPTGT